jgi:hypothetical protein
MPGDPGRIDRQETWLRSPRHRHRAALVVIACSRIVLSSPVSRAVQPGPAGHAGSGRRKGLAQGGRVCGNKPVRADYPGTVVWDHITHLLADPALFRAELRCGFCLPAGDAPSSSISGEIAQGASLQLRAYSLEVVLPPRPLG